MHWSLKMAIKYYAVVAGRTPGIYTDWKTVEPLVKGYPGAIFKSFFSVADAESFMRNSTSNVQNNAISPHTLALTDKTIIYTDGSFGGNLCGFGVVILTKQGDKITAHGKVNLPVITNNVGELYAIYVALSLVQNDVIIYTDSAYAISCLTTHVHDWVRNGWNGVANRDLIEAIYYKMQGRNVGIQKVLAHSGIELNEEVDELANTGRLGTEQLVIVKNGTVIQSS